MRIEVNGKPQDIQARTLAEALAELGLTDAVLATAVNGCFVSSTERDEIPLQYGDRVEIVMPMQGG
ncbi:sulfur carrier protein ThiS [Oricola cellulosilytica]|uniref:Sulfur carrier protein ThiS n=1 Tax=Oricola cellulosilytica TaxID=1429082 RepID=A0A4R0P8E3_9HYPH|nr:sulfur carrier protein ThiS [Oricola cellulosilytica]TCD13334.1 sulfur carrier protein ThiS [Oricola cellulosilytica]